MAIKSENTALALVIQPTIDTFVTPTQPADLLAISALRPSIQGITIDTDEYTGSVIKNAPSVAGKRFSMSFNVKLRPPGGTIPAANAFLLGRLLQAAKMAEVRTTTAIPASPEAVSAGSTSGATLGVGATGTADLYKGMAIQLRSPGVGLKLQTTAIRSYTAAKVMGLIELLGSTLTGNYQIPPQLSYVRAVDADEPPMLSMQAWFGGDRFDLVNGRVTALQFVIPVSTKTQAAYPEVQITVEADILTTAAQVSPATPVLGAVPFFKDGKMWMAQRQVGASTFTLDLGITGEAPPNPNKVDGSDPSEMVGSVATLSMTRQRYDKSILDTLALADAQANHGFLAQWGSTSGNMVQIVIPDFRFDYQNPDMGGAFVNEQGNLYIDALSKGVCINFPYGVAIP